MLRYHCDTLRKHKTKQLLVYYRHRIIITNVHEQIPCTVKCQCQLSRLQELFHMDLGAEELVTQAYTQMFITSWTGLKKM